MPTASKLTFRIGSDSCSNQLVLLFLCTYVREVYLCLSLKADVVIDCR